MEKMPVGIFTSIGSGLGAGLDAVKSLGVHTVQLHTPPPEFRAPEKVAEIKKQFEEAGITVTVVFCGFEGESYETIPVVEETIGLVPPATREERLKETLEISAFARALGVDAIGMHLGAVPEDTSAPEYAALLDAVRTVCDTCASNNQRFHLETGQETAKALLRFIQDVDRDNLAVNFDPANMILYQAGEPIEALKLLGRTSRASTAKTRPGSATPTSHGTRTRRSDPAT